MFVQVRGTRAWSPTGLIPWFSKTEGNTYATLLCHPFLFKGKPTQCSRGSTPPSLDLACPQAKNRYRKTCPHAQREREVSIKTKYGHSTIMLIIITTTKFIIKLYHIASHEHQYHIVDGEQGSQDAEVALWAAVAAAESGGGGRADNHWSSTVTIHHNIEVESIKFIEN